jgi:hypothetical protein
LLSFAYHIIDGVQHPVLVGPKRLIREIIQVHGRQDALGRDKCYP